MNEKQIVVRVDAIAPLTDNILQLKLVPKHYVEYQAGQYLQILNDNEALSYSIANAPLGAHHYELHLRHHPDNAGIQSLLASIKTEGTLTIRLPFGGCHFSRLVADRPILFVAGGTGFAPVKAMIEQLLANSDPRAFELYWGARSISDLYMDGKVRDWQTHVPHFCYFSLSSSVENLTLADMLIKRHAKDLKDYQFVLSGPFDMVYDTADCLISQGADRNYIFSDAFDFKQGN